MSAYFWDIGTPNGTKDFDIYHYVKEQLILRGILEDEIAFIHDAKSDAQRDILFKEMRTVKKRVLIGSTDKCGTGVNVQTHLVAMYHIDCPWKPSSIEQREGRGIRQGNENSEVAVSCICEDIGEATLSYAEIKERDAELIRNPEFAITVGTNTFVERTDGER